jgi:hypothetical protein
MLLHPVISSPTKLTNIINPIFLIILSFKKNRQFLTVLLGLSPIWLAGLGCEKHPSMTAQQNIVIYTRFLRCGFTNEKERQAVVAASVVVV